MLQVNFGRSEAEVNYNNWGDVEPEATRVIRAGPETQCKCIPASAAVSVDLPLKWVVVAAATRLLGGERHSPGRQSLLTASFRRTRTLPMAP
jgi:hypothetical protein